MLGHKSKTIAESMNQGVSYNEAWLRELVLVVNLPITSFLSGIYFTALKIVNKKGEVFFLDPITTESNGKESLMIHFESNIKDLKETFDSFGSVDLNLDPYFNLEKFFKEVDKIDYVVENLDGDISHLFNTITSASFHHPETNINVPCNISLEKM